MGLNGVTSQPWISVGLSNVWEKGTKKEEMDQNFLFLKVLGVQSEKNNPSERVGWRKR